MRSLIITMVSSIILSITSCGQSKSDTSNLLNKEDLQVVDYLFKDYTVDKPGASVMVIKNGLIVHEQNYGMAVLETQEPTTSQTNYRIASVTKQFTAMAIMILIDQGKLNYQTKLTEIFPDFPKYADSVTVRQLLTHQSGLIDYYGFFDDNRDKQALDAEVLDNLMTLDSTYFTPGSKHQYSNSGYAVLAQIVEKISERTFADFMNTEVFKKLEMNTSTVFELDNDIANRAYGYSIVNDTITFNDQSVTSAIQGDGGIYSSTLDYYKWDQALYSNKLIPKSKLQDAFFNWDNNERMESSGYGYGWYVDYKKGMKILYHSGGTAGFETQVVRVPSQKISAVIFTNSNQEGINLYRTANALIGIYSGYKVPVPIDVMMKKAIAEKGIHHGIQVYDELKNNDNYEVKQTTLGWLGSEYLRNDEPEKAKELFIKATLEDPNYFGGYYGLARISRDSGQIEDAIENYKKVIELGTPGEEWILGRAKKELQILLENKPAVKNK